MFSNRFWFAKVVAAAGLFAYLSIETAGSYVATYPKYVAYLHRPGSEGPVYLGPIKVEEPDFGGFVVATADARIRVRSGAHPATGNYVHVRGRWEKDGTVSADEVIVVAEFPVKRAAMFVASIVVLIVLALNFYSSFRAGSARG